MRHRRWYAHAIAASAVLMAACQDLPTKVPSAGTPALSVQATAARYTAEHVVIFDAGVPADFDARIAALGGTVVRVLQPIGVAIVTGLSDDGAADLAAARDISAAARDVSVQALPIPSDIVTQALPTGSPAPVSHDPTAAAFFPIQWDMHIIHVDDAWTAGFDDASGVRVAILDTGIDPFHIDMVGRVDASSSIAFVNSLNGAGPAWGDDHFHGTHVAGTVSTNGLGTSGVAPHATLVAVKVCNVVGSCSFAAMISGLVHAADVDVDVINMSISGLVNLPSGAGPLMGVFNRAINYAASKGALVVSAAGNNGLDLQHLERDFGVNAFRASPCENGAGVCVSSTGPGDMIASYSNYGRSAINVAAPGGDASVGGSIFNTMVLAPCSTLSLVSGGVCAGNGVYIFLEGTSMAAPHVAGAAAMIDARSGGGMNAGQLRSALQKSADDLGKSGADPFYGAGRINVGRSLGVIP